MKWKLFTFAVFSTTLSSFVYADDIIGTWKHIDDRTGTPKAFIQIYKEKDNTYTGKITKVTPRPGYTPKTLCVNCPAPYTNQPILGLEIIHGLRLTEPSAYEGGKIVDPLTGKAYSLKAKVSASGTQLNLRGYIGLSTLGRTQIWIREGKPKAEDKHKEDSSHDNSPQESVSAKSINNERTKVEHNPTKESKTVQNDTSIKVAKYEVTKPASNDRPQTEANTKIMKFEVPKQVSYETPKQVSYNDKVKADVALKTSY